MWGDTRTSFGLTNSSVVVNSWLRQCLDVRDLGRILEPYLTVLLNPRTHSVPLAKDKSFCSKIKETLNEIFKKDDMSDGEFDEVSSTTSTTAAVVGGDSSTILPTPGSVNVVHADIAKGKIDYRTLVSNLTLSQGCRG